MEPVFTLPYSEYAVANRLSQLFKATDGFSLYAPLSRQEKGVDLLITKRLDNRSASLTIQVKSSRTYTPAPPKKKQKDMFRYYTWFNIFEVPKQADIFTLIGLYPPEENRTKKMAVSWWSSLILVFTQDEMVKFIKNLQTKKGQPETKFGFGFNDEQRILLTRGGNMEDYTNFLLQNRIDLINNLIDERFS